MTRAFKNAAPHDTSTTSPKGPPAVAAPITCTRYGPVELPEGKTYTPELLRQFDLLTLRLSSPVQMERITARLNLKEFEALHGTNVCQAMFEVLKARDAEREGKS